MGSIGIAVVGVGNCASSLIQGIEFYRGKTQDEAVGLMHWDVGGYFGYSPAKTIAKTFENSTQYGYIFNSEEGNQFKRYKSPQPAMNIHRLSESPLALEAPIDSI